MTWTAWEALKWIVFMLALFAYMAIYWWLLHKRRLMESTSRYEVLRRAAESAGGVDQALAFFREADDRDRRRHLAAVRLASCLALAVGVGMLIAIAALGGWTADRRAVMAGETLAAAIVTAVGVGLWVYGLLERERQGDPL